MNIFQLESSFGLPKCDIKITEPPSLRILVIVGIVALIRVSSVISKRSFNGTLKSTRTNARLPRKIVGIDSLHFFSYVNSCL
jgi:hypothetical protein